MASSHNSEHRTDISSSMVMIFILLGIAQSLNKVHNCHVMIGQER